MVYEKPETLGRDQQQGPEDRHLYTEWRAGRLKSACHPSLWFVVKPACVEKPPVIRCLMIVVFPTCHFLENMRTLLLLAYVDDFFAAGPEHVLQVLLDELLKLWKASAPDFLGGKDGDVDVSYIFIPEKDVL